MVQVPDGQAYLLPQSISGDPEHLLYPPEEHHIIALHVWFYALQNKQSNFAKKKIGRYQINKQEAIFLTRIWIRKFLGLPDPDPNSKNIFEQN